MKAYIYSASFRALCAISQLRSSKFRDNPKMAAPVSASDIVDLVLVIYELFQTAVDAPKDLRHLEEKCRRVSYLISDTDKLGLTEEEELEFHAWSPGCYKTLLGIRLSLEGFVKAKSRGLKGWWVRFKWDKAKSREWSQSLDDQLDLFNAFSTRMLLKRP